MPLSNELPELTTQQTDLDRVCRLIESANVVALDTEFVRTNTYAPQLGLLQIHVDGQLTCVDPLADFDMHLFWDLLLADKRTLILHSAKQDMEVIWYEKKGLPGKLVDTQICAGLLGYPAQIGYAGITTELLDANVNKSQTRTDWSRRPLSTAQIKYALEDVEHLPTLHNQLQARLEELDRYAWALEDSAEMLDESLYEPDPNIAWQRIKSIPYLPVEQQARARALAEWRERSAIKSNRPRQWIISDKALLELAQANPNSEQALKRLSELPDAVARKQGRKLLAILDGANQLFSQGDIELEQLTPERDQDKTLLKKLGAIVKDKASQLDIAPEVLASKRDIQALLRGEPNARITRGWRNGIIGAEIIAELD